jgi:hypothetical protein
VKKLSLAVIFAATFASAQTPAVAPLTPATTVSRTTQAMHYRLPGESSKVSFQGTDLLQGASGEAKVEGKKTNFEIDAKFEGLRAWKMRRISAWNI